MNNLSIGRIYKIYFFSLFIYIFVAVLGRSKIVEHRKEEKYAGMGNEYSHNLTNECVANF